MQMVYLVECMEMGYHEGALTTFVHGAIWAETPIVGRVSSTGTLKFPQILKLSCRGILHCEDGSPEPLYGYWILSVSECTLLESLVAHP